MLAIMSCYIFYTAVCLFRRTTSENIDVVLVVEKDNWKDPMDPIFSAHQLSVDDCFNTLELCEADLHTCCGKGVSSKSGSTKRLNDPTLKHIVRKILEHLSIDINETNAINLSADIYIDASDLEILKRYVTNDDGSITLREQVRMILEHFIVKPEAHPVQSLVDRFTEIMISYLAILNTIVLIPALFILIRSRITIRTLVLIIFFTSFVLSVFTAYNRKYKEIIAVRMANSERNSFDRCEPKGWPSHLYGLFASLIYLPKKDDCLQYYEEILITPIHHISALDVVSEVLSNFIFTPLSALGRHFKLFVHEFYGDFNIFFFFIKTLLLCISLTFLCVITCLIMGYRVRSLFFTLEPSPEVYAGVPNVPYLRSAHSRNLCIHASPTNTLSHFNQHDTCHCVGTQLKRRRLSNVGRSRSVGR